MHEMSYVVKIVNQALQTLKEERDRQTAETDTGIQGTGETDAGTQETVETDTGIQGTVKTDAGTQGTVKTDAGAQEAAASVRVRKVVVEVGEMTDILPSYLCRYYSEVIAGTALEGSELDVRVIPVKIRCGDCGTVYHPDRENHYQCPRCGGAAGRILSGRGLRLQEMVLEGG